MKHKIALPKTEIEQIIEECKAQGLDYHKLPINVESDMMGNIINITNGIPEHSEKTHVRTTTKGKKIFSEKTIPPVLPNIKFLQILKNHGIE